MPDRATPKAPPPTLDEIERVFAALAHEVRRHIVLVLSNAGGELPSGYLAARFQHSWPTTTRHLGILEKAGIVEVRREGRNSHYRLARERLQHVLEGWLRHLTPVTPAKTWEPTGPRSTSELARGRTNERSTNETNERKGKRWPRPKSSASP